MDNPIDAKYRNKTHPHQPCFYKPCLRSLLIDVQEVIYLTVFDVSGAYLNSDTPEYNFILIDIEGNCFDIMCKVNLENRENVRIENMVKVIYIYTTSEISKWMKGHNLCL